MEKPKVAILMGSKSDAEKIKPAVDTLNDLQIPCAVRVMSAHRTPAKVAEFAGNAEAEGIQVLIAAAGMAAHLAGVVAAHTMLPVIGIPVQGGALNGLDALLATVQMPGGIPVGTTAIGGAGAKNAALLAARIIALQDKELRQRLQKDRENQEDSVSQADQSLQQELGL